MGKQHFEAGAAETRRGAGTGSTFYQFSQAPFPHQPLLLLFHQLLSTIFKVVFFFFFSLCRSGETWH